MAEFLIAYIGEKDMSNEEGMRQMQRWKSWIASLGDAVVNPGTPLAHTRVVGEDGSVTEADAAQRITGFSVVQADDLDAAMAMAKQCPYLGVMGTLQVAQMINMS